MAFTGIFFKGTAVNYGKGGVGARGIEGSQRKTVGGG